MVQKISDDNKVEYLTEDVPSADITSVSVERIGYDTVNLIFEINERGTMQETIDPYYLNESEYIQYISIPRPLDYSFFIETDQNKYYIEYTSGYCILNYRYYLDCSIEDLTFMTSFQLDDANEIITKIAAQVVYMNVSISSESVFNYIDLAPESYFFNADIDTQSIAGTCEPVKFTGIAYSFTEKFVGELHGIDMSYTWDFGDGNVKEGKKVTHSYQQPGDYLVELKVMNKTGDLSIAYQNITVMQGDCIPPNFEIIAPNNAIYLFGQKIPLFSFKSPIIIGDINISVDAFDEGSGIDRVEFFIDEECTSIDYSAPYNYTWVNEQRFLIKPRHSLTIRCYDGFQNVAEEQITVFRFL